MRCFGHYMRCFEHYMRCFKHHMRCFEHYMRCFKHYMRCFEHYMRCFKYCMRCFKHYTRCFGHYMRCFEHYMLCFEHYTQCFHHYTQLFHHYTQLFTFVRVDFTFVRGAFTFIRSALNIIRGGFSVIIFSESVPSVSVVECYTILLYTSCHQEYLNTHRIFIGRSQPIVTESRSKVKEKCYMCDQCVSTSFVNCTHRTKKRICIKFALCKYVASMSFAQLTALGNVSMVSVVLPSSLESNPSVQDYKCSRSLWTRISWSHI